MTEAREPLWLPIVGYGIALPIVATVALAVAAWCAVMFATFALWGYYFILALFIDPGFIIGILFCAGLLVLFGIGCLSGFSCKY